MRASLVYCDKYRTTCALCDDQETQSSLSSAAPCTTTATLKRTDSSPDDGLDVLEAQLAALAADEDGTATATATATATETIDGEEEI